MYIACAHDDHPDWFRKYWCSAYIGKQIRCEFYCRCGPSRYSSVDAVCSHRKNEVCEHSSARSEADLELKLEDI